jgi:hypothetical protein
MDSEAQKQNDGGEVPDMNAAEKVESERIDGKTAASCAAIVPHKKNPLDFLFWKFLRTRKIPSTFERLIMMNTRFCRTSVAKVCAKRSK